MKKSKVISLFLVLFLLPVIFFIGDKAQADTYPAGSLIALAGVNEAAVYYLGDDGKKYIFPDSKTYFTWYSDFSSVQKVSHEVLDLYPDGGLVPFRGGSKLITHQNTNKVYAVEPGGLLRWIKDAETARNLYGDNWGQLVSDVSPGFFSTSYTIGLKLKDRLPTGTIIKQRGANTYYYIEGSARRRISTDMFAVNNINTQYAVELDSLETYSEEFPVITKENQLTEAHYRYKYHYDQLVIEDNEDVLVVPDENNTVSDDGNLATSLVTKNQFGNVRNLATDNDYLYIVGKAGNKSGTDRTLEYEGALLMKLNKGDLSTVSSKALDGAFGDEFTKIIIDDTYIYAVGRAGIYSPALVAKFNKSDLSLVDSKIYDLPRGVGFADMFISGDYIYAAGGYFNNQTDAFVLKINKNTLNIEKAISCGKAQDEKIMAITGDNNYIYLLGDKGIGRFLLKLNQSDLSVVTSKEFFNPGQGIYEMDIISNDNFLYVIDGASVFPLQTGLIMKFDKSDLSLLANKAYSSTDNVSFFGINLYNDDLYVSGQVSPAGNNNDDAILLKLNSDSLAPSLSKRYSIAENVWMDELLFDGALYSLGNMAFDGIILKLQDLNAGSHNSTPTGHVLSDISFQISDVGPDYIQEAELVFNNITVTELVDYPMELVGVNLSKDKFIIN
jgi:hypothetical protein